MHPRRGVLILLLAASPAAAGPPPVAGPPKASSSDATFWAERDGQRLHATVDLRPVLDAAWRKRLQSGLACVVAVEVRLRAHDGGKILGRLRRLLRVRWDLWAERMRKEPGGELDSAATEWDSLDGFLRDVAYFDRRAIAERIPLDPTIYRLEARIELNPWSVQATALPATAGQRPPPLEVFETVLEWAEEWKPGQAEREARATGHPFRGDRLPFVPASAPP